ncbi:hypothetical protein PRIC2_010959 [Phytophthora ramorum]
MTFVPASENDSDEGIAGLDLNLDPALLTFLENYAMVSPHLTTGSTGDAFTDAKAPPTQQGEELPAGKKKSWHQRRRAEILRLRGEVGQLSAALQHHKANTDSRAATTTTSRRSVSMWENIAMQQLGRMQTSTEENTRLREIVRQHDLQIKAIQRAFKRRMNAAVVHPISFASNLGSLGTDPPLFDKAVFKELTAGMDDMYAELDDFFNQVKMNQLPCPSQRNDSQKYHDKGVFVELLDCYAVPFDLRQTEQAVWALKSTPSGESSVILAEYLTADESTRLKSVCVGVRRHESEVRLVVHLAVRKYVEKDRTVFIGRTLVEPLEQVFGVVFKETTRVVVKHGEPSITGPTTVMQTHCRVTDHEKPLDSHCVRASWKKTPFYESGSQAWQHSVSSFKHKVEDMLLLKSQKESSRPV